MPPPLTPGSPEWWLSRLEKRLREDARVFDQLDDYYAGRHPLAFTSKKFRQAFGGLFDAFSDNWMQIVVDAVEERLNIEGFRLGADQDERGDEQAWRIWQANQLDADSQIAHTEALVKSRCYALVSPFEADQVADGVPAITVESPRETIVAFEAGSRRRRAAALKLWEGDDGHELATLYLPDTIFKWRSSKAGKPSGADPARWEPRDVPGEDWPLDNPLERVPVVPLVNRPALDGSGESEIANVIPTQDAINKLVADMIVASEYGAFRQRYATGYEIPMDPATGEPIPNVDLKASISRLWVSEDPNTKFGEFDATDLSNYVGAVEMLVQHIASQTRTPPHYFYLSGQFPSGESIKSAETGLVAKARRKMRHFGEGWEEVIRLAFAALGDARAGATDAETIWGDPESRSESEHVDAVLKMKALGVPPRALWEELGFTPQQITRFEQAAAREALLGQAVDLTSFLPTGEGNPGGDQS